MRTTFPRLATLCLSLCLTACGRSGDLDTRVFDLQHLEPDVAYEIVLPYVFEDHPESPGSIALSHQGRTLTVRERPDNLDRIARVLEERDRPRPGVSLHFQIIEAGPGEPAADPRISEIEAALRGVFRFESYRLVGEAAVRAADQSNFQQRVAGPAGHIISGNVKAVRAEGEGAPSARLFVEFWSDERTVALSTTVNLADGGTVVLGTAGGSGDDGALILAVRPVFEP